MSLLQSRTGKLLRVTRPVRRMPWAYDDGGRAAAGFPYATGDCVVRAVAIASARPYREVHEELDELAGTFTDNPRFAGASARTGIPREIFRLYLKEAGWTWHPVMGIGTGCTMHLRAGEVPPGRIIARVSRHLTAVINGTIRDTFDPSRAGTRCIYGYFIQDEQENDETAP
jgi:hypothetical protein